MRSALSFALLAALAAPATAQDDPLKSPACGAALAQLQAARAAGGDVEEQRSAAATACLGSGSVPRRPSRVAQPPVRVPPPQIEVPPQAATLPAPVLPPPALAIERAPGPGTCDAGGCWTQGGSHLRHVPPALVGPQGVCTRQGGVVVCP